MERVTFPKLHRPHPAVLEVAVQRGASGASPGKEEVSVSGIFIQHSPFEGLVEMFHQVIGLRVVARGLEVFYLQQLTQVTHEFRDKSHTLVG